MRRGLFFAFICIVIFGPVRAEEADYPKAMAVLGDSISEGILADYSYENGLRARELFRMIGFLNIRDKEERINAFRKHYAARDKAWASGDNEESIVLSHYRRLKKVAPDLYAQNFAVAGAESIELESQVDQLLAHEKEFGVEFDYVLLMIGGNDLKKDSLERIPSAVQFVGNVETQLRRILETRDFSYIFILGIPDIFKIFEETKDLVVARIFGKPYTCDDLRRRIYNSVLFSQESSGTEWTVKPIFEQYHSGLESLLERLSDEFPKFRFKIHHSYPSGQNAEKIISVDCFHPSEWGQAELAEISWRNGFWPELKPQIPSNLLSKLK